MGSVCAMPADNQKGNLTQVNRSLIQSSGACYRGWVEWDTSEIPVGSQINNVSMTYTVEFGSVNGTPECDVWSMEIRPSTFTDVPNEATDLWTDAANGTRFVDSKGTPFCADTFEYPDMLENSVQPSERYRITFDTNANQHLQDSLAQKDWWAVGIKFDNEVRTGASHAVLFNWFAPKDDGDIFFLEVEYDPAPDPVVDLIAVVAGDTDMDLSWTLPFLHGGTQNGTQINFTTPFGDPLTIITNVTTTNDTSATVTGLTSGTDYSFRVSVWTECCNNANGNIANGTTAEFGNFTVGFFDLDASQFDARDIKYTRVDLNTTHTNLEVVHPNAFNLTCSFYYKLAIKNQTFNNLATVPEGFVEQKATFQFHDVQNDIIDVRCTDVNTSVSADYLLTQANFELLTQFANFRSGVYGTAGQFGSIDMITLGAIIVAMIGFNRVNESVGAIFAVIILGVLSYFEIVVWQTFMFGTVAIVLMLVIASTRKVG